MEIIKRINGNGKPYETKLPKLVMQTKYINDVALAHIKENTGLKFIKTAWNTMYEERIQSINNLFYGKYNMGKALELLRETQLALNNQPLFVYDNVNRKDSYQLAFEIDKLLKGE